MVLVADNRGAETASKKSATQVVVAIPFYRNEHLVGPLVESLIACAGDIRALDATVLLFNDSPDYPPLSDALNAACGRIGSAFPVEVRTNSANLGWLKTANLAMREAAASGADIMLLNSDVVVFPGALREMAAVAALDPMIGFVNPRSNNATLASFPIGEHFKSLPPVEAEAAFRSLSETLPRFLYVPTAVGFAVFIRRFIIEEFGVFDEVYGGGYNEENDLVMRASRCGYRAVLANRAFVWHQGEQSLSKSDSSKALKEEQNRKILLGRYPEYQRIVAAWFDSPAFRAERLLSSLAPPPHRKRRIAFDFSSFGAYHSGTIKAGIQLLSTAAQEWPDAYEICVICEPSTFAFHGLDKLAVTRCNIHEDETFAAIFRVGQPTDWDDLKRLALKGAVVGVYMLDTIVLDCSHLYSPVLETSWRHALTYSDFIVYNSEFTARQFNARFQPIAPRQAVSLHSLDLDDYAPAALGSGQPASKEIEAVGEGYILVLGNHYPHKAVSPTANAIALQRPDLQVVALGVARARNRRHPLSFAETPLADAPNLKGFRAGELTDADMEALQLRARLIVMASHYEGFGFALPIALAMKKPIVVRAIPALLEVHRALGSSPNVHFYSTTAQLLRLLDDLPAWIETKESGTKGDGRRAAQDIRTLLDTAIAVASYTTILERFRAVYTSPDAWHEISHHPADQIARHVGVMIEGLTARLLHNRFVYAVMRTLFRAARFVTGKGWGS